MCESPCKYDPVSDLLQMFEDVDGLTRVAGQGCSVSYCARLPWRNTGGSWLLRAKISESSLSLMQQIGSIRRARESMHVRWNRAVGGLAFYAWAFRDGSRARCLVSMTMLARTLRPLDVGVACATIQLRILPRSKDQSIRHDRRANFQSMLRAASCAAAKSDSRSLYGIVYQAAGNAPDPHKRLRDKSGCLLTDATDIKARWVEHYTELLSAQPITEEPTGRGRVRGRV